MRDRIYVKVQISKHGLTPHFVHVVLQLMFFRHFKGAFMSKSSNTISAMFLAAALTTLVPLTNSISHSAYASETKTARINVTGEGRVFVAPDMATLTMGVVSEAETAQQALEENNTKMAAVINAMKAEGIASKDLQTANFNIQPKMVYDRPKNGEEQKPPRIVGYRVSNDLSVLVRDLKLVGTVLDTSIGLGINSGGNIRFGNEDPKEVISKARTAAMLDARDRAETLVSAIGAGLGKIIEINESSFRPQPVPMAKGRMMADAAFAESVPVEAGENAYSVSVSVSWEISQ